MGRKKSVLLWGGLGLIVILAAAAYLLWWKVSADVLTADLEGSFSFSSSTVTPGQPVTIHLQLGNRTPRVLNAAWARLSYTYLDANGRAIPGLSVSRMYSSNYSLQPFQQIRTDVPITITTNPAVKYIQGSILFKYRRTALDQWIQLPEYSGRVPLRTSTTSTAPKEAANNNINSESVETIEFIDESDSGGIF